MALHFECGIIVEFWLSLLTLGFSTGTYRHSWGAEGIPSSWEDGETHLGKGTPGIAWELWEYLVTGRLGKPTWAQGAKLRAKLGAKLGAKLEAKLEATVT